MLEEIIPAMKKPGQKSRIVEAETTLTSSLPDIDTRISFLPFINHLKLKKDTRSDTQEGFFGFLLKKFETAPGLAGAVEREEMLEENGDLLELVSTSLFPMVSDHEKNHFALAAPYEFKTFYYSDCFKKLFIDEKEENLLLPPDLSAEELKAIQVSMVYDHILEKFYGIQLNDSPALIYKIVDRSTGMRKFYRMRYDRRFIEVYNKRELPPIQDCAVCLNTFRILDIEKQLRTMPLDLFEVHGFAVWVAEDVTVSESLDSIKKILLHQDDCDVNIINDLKSTIQAIVGLQDIEVGLMPFTKVNDRYVIDEECTRQSLVGEKWRSGNAEDEKSFNDYMGFISEMSQPMPVSNVTEELLGFAPHMKIILDKGMRSYIHYPMQNSDGLLGLLELASPEPNALTQEIVSKLEPAIPLISVAMLKNRDTFQHRIEKIIKEKFTALQQSVEWKFAEVAWDHLKKPGAESGSGNVVFEGVYPLYGAIDIRNSSQERNHAIQKDLKEHLVLVDEVLEKLLAQVQLPLLEGLKFKTLNMQDSIKNTMLTEDEIKINEFLEAEVDPVFLHLQKANSTTGEIIDGYFNRVKDAKSNLYRNRREYDETLGMINEAVLRYLIQEDEAIQASYPHYFEKYRTDGVEYNIYIGQSIAPQNPFDILYLKNIRLWQLKSMAEVARITNSLLPKLHVPLETTQLILIQSQCISIHFRRDEKRFDVEGSYNIRYEVIKKRLDKVRIKDTGERLTQPGKIAMVYSNQKEVPEYQQYIEFLQNKNILLPGIEFIELEELQGIKGLKAMRVSINME